MGSRLESGERRTVLQFVAPADAIGFDGVSALRKQDRGSIEWNRRSRNRDPNPTAAACSNCPPTTRKTGTPIDIPVHGVREEVGLTRKPVLSS
jgi:hypothetical protein